MKGELEMFGGISIDILYIYVLIGCAVIAFLLVLFGDLFHFDGPVDPMLIIPWLAFTSLFGYLGDRLFSLSHLTIFIISVVLSIILVFLLNFYVLMPIKNAESTISISEKDMEGNTALVVTPIPIKGMGEISFSSVTGSMSRPAAFYVPQERQLNRGEQVLIIEIKERVCYVIPYENSLKI